LTLTTPRPEKARLAHVTSPPPPPPPEPDEDDVVAVVDPDDAATMPPLPPAEEADVVPPFVALVEPPCPPEPAEVEAAVDSSFGTNSGTHAATASHAHEINTSGLLRRPTTVLDVFIVSCLSK